MKAKHGAGESLKRVPVKAEVPEQRRKRLRPCADASLMDTTALPDEAAPMDPAATPNAAQSSSNSDGPSKEELQHQLWEMQKNMEAMRQQLQSQASKPISPVNQKPLFSPLPAAATAPKVPEPAGKIMLETPALEDEELEAPGAEAADDAERALLEKFDLDKEDGFLKF